MNLFAKKVKINNFFIVVIIVVFIYYCKGLLGNCKIGRSSQELLVLANLYNYVRATQETKMP